MMGLMGFDFEKNIFSIFLFCHHSQFQHLAGVSFNSYQRAYLALMETSFRNLNTVVLVKLKQARKLQLLGFETTAK